MQSLDTVESLTVDDFSKLGIDEHREAVEVYDASITELARQLTQLSPGTAPAVQVLDKLSRQATVRKVHLGRLKEMESEQQMPFNAETDQLLS